MATVDVDERDPDPPEPEPLLNLDEVEAAHRASMLESRVTGRHTTFVLDAVPGLLAELREARAALAEVRAAERCEYAITADGNPPDVSAALATAEQVDASLADGSPSRAWVRTVATVSGWHPLSAEAPF